MGFETKTDEKRISRMIGYLLGYFVFTTILYFILILLDKLPETWNYFNIMIITFIIILIGELTREILK